MTNLDLFDQQLKKVCSNKSWIQSEICNLLNSNEKELVEIKKFLQNWFSRLPHEEQKRIHNLFTSKEKSQHRGGFFELYLHEILSLAGYTIEYQPKIKADEEPTDFYVERTNTRFYLEATIKLTDSLQKIKKTKLGDIEIHETSVWKILSKTLKLKYPAKYSLENEPYIIAVNICTNGMPIIDEDIYYAIYGFLVNIEELNIAIISSGQIGKYNEEKDSFFYNNRNVSALIVTTNLNAWSLTEKKATLYINPVANNPIPIDILPISTVYFDEKKGKYITSKGKNNKDLFNL